MALIRDRKPAQDRWRLLKLGTAGEMPAIPVEADAAGALPTIPPDGDVIVPFAAWRAQRGELLARSGGLGIWLSGADDSADIAKDFAHFGVIAVHFPSFTDGRGYSTGRLLRQRYGWTGELRAIGDVQRDQLFDLTRCGFDAFDLRAGENIDVALEAFSDFSEAYQASVERPLPLFRRREVAGSSA
jgi:uncharacterized protein (DUF934 family)